MKRFLVGCLTCGLAAVPLIGLVGPSLWLTWLSFRFDFYIHAGHIFVCVVVSAIFGYILGIVAGVIEYWLHREHPEWWTK